MFVLSGNLQRFGLTSWLVLALVGPAFAAVYAAWAMLRHAWGRAEPTDEPASAAPDVEALRRVALGGQLAAVAILVWQGATLFDRGPDERFLVQHVVRLVRSGFFDVSLDLALDPASAILGVVACLAGAGLFAGNRVERPGRIALASVASLGTLVAVLSAGWPTMVAGLAIAGLASATLARSPGAFATAALAEASTIAGAGLLFWCLGGTLSPDVFLPDLDPRVVAVQRAPSDGPLGDDDDDAPSVRITKDGKSESLRPTKKTPSSLDGRATVSLAGPSGAIVFLDESHTPMVLPSSSSTPAYAPFVRLPVAPGLHTFRVHAGAGLDDHLVQHVTVQPGDDIVLTTVGSVSSFREAIDMVALRTAQGPRFQEALAARRAGAWPALLVVFALLALGTALRAAHAAALGAAREPWVLHAAVGALLVLRLAPLAGLLASASTVLVVAGAVVAVVAAAWMALAPRRDVLAGGVVAVLVGLAMVGAGTQSVPAAMGALVAAMLGGAALAVAGEGAPELGGEPSPHVGRAALGLCVGALCGVAGILSAVADAPAGGFALVASAAATGGLTFGALRAAIAQGTAPKAKKKAKAKTGDRRGPVVLALAVLAAVCGLLVGFSPRLGGGTEAGPLEAALRPLAAPAAASSRLGLVVVVAAGLGGWAVARARYQGAAERALANDAAWGTHRVLVAGLGLVPLARFAGGAVMALARVARLADDRIVGAVWGALAEGARMTGSVLGGRSTTRTQDDAKAAPGGARPVALVVLVVFLATGLALYLWSNA
jgi:hypothetical protein